jgi:hypothetical protein
MAGDKPPFPTPAELKAMAAAFKRLERAEKKRPRPETPELVELNRRAREFWNRQTRKFEGRIAKRPDDVARAVRDFREDVMREVPARSQKDILERVLRFADDESRAQSLRGRQKKRNDEPDAIDRVILAGIADGETANLIRKRLKSETETSADLDYDARLNEIYIARKDGSRGRHLRMSGLSIDKAVSVIRKKI